MNSPAESRGPASVLIVDDSAFMRTALSRMISAEADLTVVGTAWSGEDALLKIASLNPDVVTLDVEMPGISGLETLRSIMANSPRPVIMVSSLTVKNAETTFEALQTGAFDYVPKQLSANSLEIEHIRRDLTAKIRAAAFSRRTHLPPVTQKKPPQASLPQPYELPSIPPAIVAIGTSTGGPKALQEILPLLPKHLPVPLLIVQHMPAGFITLFAQRLDSLCSLTVREATHREPLHPGVVYIAPAGLHMRVERPSQLRALISLDPQPAKHLHVPSVDILMQSVAENYGSFAMGVIMTGMGADGALGMQAIHGAGGFTIGQDEATCSVYGMPRVCAEKGVLKRVLPLSQIPLQILQALRCRQRA
jgi:two-component system, chemotaxis family, protein-glutamate methylesterase/glutaminase